MLAIEIIATGNRLPGMARQFPGHVRDATRRALLEVVAIADPLTAVDTGALRANKTIGDDSVTWGQDYAGYIEWGTVRTSPRPFARPAAEAAMPGYVAALSKLEGLG